METLRVKVPTKRAKALLEQLQGLGVIEIEDNGASLEALATTMKRIRAGVKSKMTVKEVMAEVDTVRAERHATSRKAQVPR
jgi:predicted transcriptional regulator